MILLTILITYFISSLVGHTIHWSLHQSWSGVFYKRHMTHHTKLYPPSNYLSDIYRDPGKDNTIISFIVLTAPLFLLPVLLGVFGILQIKIVITILSVMAVIAFMHDYLHDAFHIRNQFLYKFTFFKRWSKLHYQHHVNVQTNFGIFTFYWDKLFRTFRDLPID